MLRACMYEEKKLVCVCNEISSRCRELIFGMKVAVDSEAQKCQYVVQDLDLENEVKVQRLRNLN